MQLKNKKAIVTGGASGIGKSLVKKLMEEGATVCVFDINKDALESLEKELNVKCVICDISDHEQVEEKVEKFFEEQGEIDILVNNAGIVRDSPLISLFGGIKKHDIETWNKVIATNLSAVFYMSANVAEKMVKKRTKGVIVNVSSIASAGNPGQTAYSAAKAGVNAMTRLWADELSPFGIRVAAIAPGFTNTPITEKMNQKRREEWEKKTPLRRLAEPEEIAEGIIFIIKNDYFNGKVLPLDGGLRM